MIAMVWRRFQTLLIGVLLGLSIVASLPRNAAAGQSEQKPLRTYCAGRIIAVSRVGGAASIWRYELAGDVPAALSVQLTMQTTQGWYRVVAPIVPLLQDNGVYLSAEARYKRFQVHSPAEFFELPIAAGRPKYIWVSKVGYAGEAPNMPCPAMWLAPEKRAAKPVAHVDRSGPARVALDVTKRLNLSVYDPHARPAVGAVASAVAIPEPTSATTCRKPFIAAKLKNVVAPSYPALYAQIGERWIAAVGVLVELAPDGSVVGRILESPSGRKLFDENALSAASQTTYTPKIGLCLPVPGYYIYEAEYGPQ